MPADRATLLKRLAAVETLAERGATEGERAAARDRADAIRKRLGVTSAPPRLEPLRSNLWGLWDPPTPYSRREPFPWRRPAPAPRVDDTIRLQCTCGHVTSKTVPQPLLTTIEGYRCKGCGRQRRKAAGEFTNLSAAVA